MKQENALYENLVQLVDRRNFLLERYKDFFRQYHTLYLFGAGADGVLTARLLSEIFSDKEVYFIDRNKSKHGKEIYRGIRCYGVDKMYGCDPTSTVVIITSFKYVNMLYDELAGDGAFQAADKLDCTYICDGFVRIFNTEAEAVLGNQWQQKHQQEILQSFSAFDDEPSQRLYAALLQKRLQGDSCYADLFEPDRYFPSEIRQQLTAEEVLLDCGSYVGDTIEAFQKLVKNKYKKIYAFELDAGNRGRAEKNKQLHDVRICMLPVGSGQDNAQIRYIQTDTAATSVHGTCKYGKIASAELKSVDSMIVAGELEDKITFVKINVNGTEIDTLYGMKRMLCRDKPKLAINLTNRFENLWEVPALLKKLVPDYRLTVHHHTEKQAGTVLYAVHA